MLIFYFDEVKPNPDGQPYYWLGGLAIRQEVIPEVELSLAELAHECFRTYDLTQSTEFHATDICSGNRNFRRWRDPGRRLDVLKRLAQLMDRPQDVFRVVVRMEVSRIADSVDYEAMAFMFLIEKVNQLCRGRQELGLMIGDLEHGGVVERSVSSLARYRQNGTPYAYGQDIDHLIDTVHFAQSHHSRLLQLADAYIWFMQLSYRTDEPRGIKTELLRFLQAEVNIMWPSKYKFWPGDA
ncbi:TPA: DUF3800 domain-containing protein [Stenotrophomonas maltophilia]|nr:DUF3800 domain-containing protein [Stenotrophomonas maltophilia]